MILALPTIMQKSQVWIEKELNINRNNFLISWNDRDNVNESFLSIVLSYVEMKDIVAIDSPMCNKSDKENWLQWIATYSVYWFCVEHFMCTRPYSDYSSLSLK